MAGPRGDFRALRLYQVPSSVHFEFCQVMDVLSDRDWTQFASAVLGDQTAVRLAERKEHRTDWVMVQWQNRNGCVSELLELLELLQLLRPRDIILRWASVLPPPPLPPPVVPPVVPPPVVPPAAVVPVSLSDFEPPSKAPPTTRLSPTDGARLLPTPPDPPPELQSALDPPQPLSDSVTVSNSGVMCWSYEEVHAGTCGFCSALKVGEGGFGVVYRASLKNTDCAVKRFKQDCALDWTLLKDSFQTEVEKLSKFRHPNIVDLLGFTEGGGTFCLIYSFMENRSLDDQLHGQDGGGLSWSQRVSVVKGAATALQFLHCPPEGQTALVHGDVKSSNILLDRHLEVKLADFGLARFVSRGSSGRTSALTTSIGKTQTVRGTLAYLPEEYVRDGKLRTAVDVYSFGVVLLEILTGRRALETDKKTRRDVYLKELVNDVEDTEAEWWKQLDRRLISGGAAEPTGCMQVVSLARSCLDKWKKRPNMTEVFKSLHRVQVSLQKPCSCPSSLPSSLRPSPRPRPGPALSLDSCLSALSLSAPGPSEDTYRPRPSSSSSLTPPHPLHSSSSLPPFCSSFAGPCETDESRGFSQYDVRLKSNGVGSGSDYYHKTPLNQFNQVSVPTEDQYNFPPHSGVLGPTNHPPSHGFPECTSPAESLQSLSPVQLNPSKQRLLEKKALYDEGLIQTPELLSSDLCACRSPAESRLPEESDELDYLQSKQQ